MILKKARVISPKDSIDDVLDLKIENGIIVQIDKDIQGEGIDLSGKIISPGLVDMHCHLREPGFEYKETIETGTKSAIYGGYTAICPMANTNPVIDNVESLKFIINKHKMGQESIGFCPICCITKGLNGRELTNIKLLKEEGAFAFSDDGKPLNDIGLFKQALKSGELIISHAEDEIECVARELKALKEVGGKLHFAHISTKGAIELIRSAKHDGLNITCETAPHYFSFTEDDVTADGRFKMNPPLRTREDLKAVIEGLKDGIIDCIATDHAPHSLEEKTKPFSDSPMGIIGFETALGVTLTKLVEPGYLTINQAIEKLSTNPAKIMNIENQGQIKLGKSANLTIIDPETEFIVDENIFKSKCKISPFNGMKLKGKAIAVIINGFLINLEEEKCLQSIN